MILITTIIDKLQVLNTENASHYVEVHISGKNAEFIASCVDKNGNVQTELCKTEHDLHQWLSPNNEKEP